MSKNTTKSGSVKQLNKAVIPVIRKFMPQAIASSILGVQPMTGSVGSLFTLKPRYANFYKETQDKVMAALRSKIVIQSDNKLTKLKGLYFKGFMTKYPTYRTIKLDMTKLTVVDEDFDCFCIGKPTTEDTMIIFAPEEVCTLLLLKYDAFTVVDPMKELYFKDLNMVRISANLRLDGTPCDSKV